MASFDSEIGMWTTDDAVDAEYALQREADHFAISQKAEDIARQVHDEVEALQWEVLEGEQHRPDWIGRGVTLLHDIQALRKISRPFDASSRDALKLRRIALHEEGAVSAQPSQRARGTTREPIPSREC